MNIVLNQNRTNLYNPAFKSWHRDVWKTDDSFCVQHRNDTCFYRNDLNFNKLTDYLADKYRDVPEVNVYDYACSDGSEAYSLVMSLKSRLGERNSKKFFPILAKDYDEEAIKKAQNGKYNITIEERQRINRHTNNKFPEYFYHDYNDIDYEGVTSYHPGIFLNGTVHFSKADILKDYKNINPDNSVVLLRNFWPYLDKEDRETLAKNLSEHLNSSSVVVIGDFDSYHIYNYYETAPYLLSKNNFIETDIKNVYEKAKVIPIPDYILNAK